MNKISFDRLRMNVVETATNGAVNEQTIFYFQQNCNIVSARYCGGGVKRGFLAGKTKNRILEFNYAQQHDDGNIHGGKSYCKLILEGDSIVGLVEYFKWESGEGRNVFKVIDKGHRLEEV